MRARIVLALVLAAVAPSLQAADLTVRFTGRFQPGTCELSVADVDVGTFEAPAFATVGATTPVPFELKYTNCASELLVLHLRFVGPADARLPDYFAIPASGGVRGLAVRLQSPGGLIRPNQNAFDVPTQGAEQGAVTLRASLVRTGGVSDVTAGSIRTPITVQVTYN